MSRTYRHRPVRFAYGPTAWDDQSYRTLEKHYKRHEGDAYNLRLLRKAEKRREDALLKNRTLDYDDAVWPAYRRAAAWQLPSY